MAEDEVGKVSLGLELDTGDIEKQFGQIGGKIGKPLQNAFAAAFKGIDLKPVTAGFAEAFKASITEGANAAIDAVQTRFNSLKMPDFPAPSEIASPLSSSGVRTSAAKSSKQAVDVDAANNQIAQLEQVLDNVNSKIEIQQRKLAGLKESYNNTFNEDQRNKLQEKIINVEGSLLRLTKQSDGAAAKIWKLDDALKRTADSAQQTAKETGKVANQVKQTGKSMDQAKSPKLIQTMERLNKTIQQLIKTLPGLQKPIGRVTGSLGRAARAATDTDKSFRAAGKSSGKMGNQFTQAFGRIAKQVLVFSVLYKAIRGFQSYMNSSMKTNQQYAASLNAIKTNLATAFQPVFSAVMPAINSFMSWLAKATAYIAAFMSSLFGTSYKKSFEAAKGIQTAKKAMDGYGKSAKKAASGLSALDDFNLIKTQDDPDSGGGGPGDWNMEMPDMDIDSIQSKTDSLVANMKTAFNGVWESFESGWRKATNTFGPTLSEVWGRVKPEIEGWKNTFQAVFTDILTLGEPLKNWWQTGIIPMWQNGILTATGIFTGFSESLRMVFDGIWAAAFPIVDKFVTDGLPRFTEFVTGVQDLLSGMFDVVKQIFDDIWRDAAQPALDLLSGIVRDTLDILFDWWDTWGKDIMDGLKTALDGIKQLWRNLWDNFLKPFVDNMLHMLTWLWDKHLKGLVEEIGNFVGTLVKAALDIWNKFIMPIINYVVKKLGPHWSNVFSFIGDVVGTAVGVISDVLKGLLKALGGVIDFIAGIFTADWKRAWGGMQKFMEGFSDALVGIFKGAVNLIIDALNFMVRSINKIKIDVPKWVGKIPGVPDGISSIGFNIPEIPKLAKGGIVSAPTLAMVGDNRNASIDPEVVTPLSKLQDMLSGGNAEMVGVLLTMLDVLRDIARKDPSIRIGETELGRAVVKSVNALSRQTGRTMLEI